MTDTANKEHPNELLVRQEEIRKVESEIEESLKAIRERLSAEHLKWKALQKAISSAVRTFESAAFFIRRHPVPALLAGVTLAWLALQKPQAPFRNH